MAERERAGNEEAREELRRRLEELERQLTELRRQLGEPGPGGPVEREGPREERPPSVESEAGPPPRLADAAYEVLQGLRRPAHYAELAWRLWELGLLRTSRQPETTVLTALQRDARFVPVLSDEERGIYALREWPQELREPGRAQLRSARLEGRIARRRLERERTRRELEETESALHGLSGEARRHLERAAHHLRRQLERAQHQLLRLEAEAQRWLEEEFEDVQWTRPHRRERWEGGHRMPGEAEHQEVVERTFDLGPTPRLVVSNGRGVTRITGSDGTAIQLRATKRVWVSGGEDPAALLARLQVETVVEGDTLRIAAGQGSGGGQRLRGLIEETLDEALEVRDVRDLREVAQSVLSTLRDAFREMGEVLQREFGGRGHVDLSLTVPRGSRIEVRSGSGEVWLEDIAGEVEVTSGSGDVHGARLGSASVRTGSGSVELRACSGPVDVSTGSGDVRLAQVSGAVSVRSGSGDLEASGLAGRLEAHTASGDVRLRGAIRHDADLHTASGDVTLGVEPGSSFRLDARTVSGRVSDQVTLEGGERTAHSLSGSYGAGEAFVRIRTVSGDVRLRAQAPESVA